MSVQYFRFDELLTALKVDAPLRPVRLQARMYMSTAPLRVDEMVYDPMPRDEVLATPTLDRLLHRDHVLNIKGRSYRRHDLEDALAA